MNEWKNIIMLFKTPIHVPVCNSGHKTYVLLSRFPLLFWSEWSKSHPFSAHTGSLRIAWHEIFSLSHHLLASWNLYIPRVAESKSTHFLARFNTWMSQRLLNWNPIPKLTIVLIWKTPPCLKFGKTSNRAVENLLQRKLWVWAASDANFPVFLFDLFVAQCTLVKCNALW